MPANRRFKFYGAYVPINPEDPKIYSFFRTQGPWRSIVFCNFTAEEVEYCIPPEIDIDLAVMVIANYHVYEDKLERRTILRPYEARIYSLRN